MRLLRHRSRTALLARGPLALDELRTTGARGSHVENLALADQILESHERFVDVRIRIEPMEVEEVDVLDPEALQRRLGGPTL